MTVESAADLGSGLHNKTTNNGYQWKDGHVVAENRVFDRTSDSFPDGPRKCYGTLPHAVKVNCILLSKEH